MGSLKVYILSVPSLLQPATQTFKYPAHNKDYGVEQDFDVWIRKQKNLLTNDQAEANWHYLPVYWTRWHINHNFAEQREGLDELQAGVDKIVINHKKTFTITQFDGGTLINMGEATIFTAARTVNEGIDIPILCSPHRKPPLPVKKKYLGTFNGSFSTHPIRVAMEERFRNNPDILIAGGLPTRFYKRWLWAKNYNLRTMESYVALSPRGTSCSSFRFFEAMQLGTAPCLIADVDVRPFKQFIPWDEMSYYSETVDDLEQQLNNLDKKEAVKKGKMAYKYWRNELFYQKWCKYIIKELELIS